MKHGQHSEDGDETLREAFWSVTRRMRRLSADDLAHWQITPSQSRALRVLGRHGTMRLSALSEHLRIAPRSGTGVVDELTAKDLVCRRPDPHDRRATLVELTEHGTATMKAIRAAHAADTERMFDRLSEHERTELARILRKLRD